MVKYVIDESTLIAIANEVRRLTGHEGELTPNEMAALLREFEAGSGGDYETGLKDGYDQAYMDMEND